MMTGLNLFRSAFSKWGPMMTILSEVGRPRVRASAC